MAKHRAPSSPRAHFLGRRSMGRRSLAALVTGVGVTLTPLPALAAVDTAAPAVAAPSVTASGAAATPVVGSGPSQTQSALSSAARTALATALAQQGDPYRWGGSGPNAFDCSGLTQYAYKSAGITLPHSSGAQSRMGRPVSRANLQPGDLVFFGSPVHHVAMYVGDGKIVHASTYGQPVKVIEMKYLTDFNSARRPVG